VGSLQTAGVSPDASVAETFKSCCTKIASNGIQMPLYGIAKTISTMTNRLADTEVEA
jgi:hypothetical protein